MNTFTKNWKTTLVLIITVISSIYEVVKTNAEVLGIKNKWIVIGSIIVTILTLITNAIQNGKGNNPIEKIMSHFKE